MSNITGINPAPAPDKAASQLPKPTGYKLLIALLKSEEMTEGGILKPAKTLEAEEVGSIVAYILAMGPDAYASKERFPSGPYCRVGDCVMMRSYSGTRFKVQGQEFRLINDDSVEAVVQDPRGVVKA